MNEKNFNSISQFEVPKSWIDDALTVPATHTKKPFPLIKLTRTLSAVACLVLVCGISVALYFITDNSSIPPVEDPVVTESLFADNSNNKAENDNNSLEKENYQEKTDTNSVKNPTSSGLHPENSEDKTENGADSHPEPNEKPEKPTTNKPEKPDSTKPSEDETNPQNPQQPTQPKPTYKPIPPDDPPLETEIPSEDPLPPWEPSEPSWKDPTEEPITNEYYNVFVRVDSSKLIGSKNAYCAFYDPNGNLVGGSDMFASFRLMEKGSPYDGMTAVYYYPYRMLDITVSGLYRYTFYNENGEILYENTTYLTAEK